MYSSGMDSEAASSWLSGWTEFHVTTAGAGAALAGLLIVALSVNIVQIMNAPPLPTRAAASVASLMLAVVAACLALIPAQSPWWLGVEILAAAAAVLVLEVRASRGIRAQPGVGTASWLGKTVTGFTPVTAFVIGGVLLVAGNTGGVAWMAAGILLAILGAVLFAWIALVEILR